MSRDGNQKELYDSCSDLDSNNDSCSLMVLLPFLVQLRETVEKMEFNAYCSVLSSNDHFRFQ